MNKYLILLGTIMCLSTLSFAQRPTVGGEAQDFSLVNASGEVISLSDLHGTPVVLNFWATWCVPCREELPFFQTTYDEINGTSDSHETSAAESDKVEASVEESVTESIDEDTVSDDAIASKDELETVAKNIHFVIVNNNEAAQKATDFLEEININLTSLLDASKEERKVLEDAGIELDKTLDVVKNYRVRGMPTTFYIDADGVIQVIKQGFITPQSMQEDLAKIGIDWQPVIEEHNGS